jgi:hypothetical protein
MEWFQKLLEFLSNLPSSIDSGSSMKKKLEKCFVDQIPFWSRVKLQEDLKIFLNDESKVFISEITKFCKKKIV